MAGGRLSADRFRDHVTAADYAAFGEDTATLVMLHIDTAAPTLGEVDLARVLKRIRGKPVLDTARLARLYPISGGLLAADAEQIHERKLG